ncbi:MAG TPA: methyltransferase, partial [Polyangia bacterium]|nr:methyltransferase [Polyangia bacterium]
MRPRRGLGGWLALFVAGEAVEVAALRPLPTADERAALVACDFVRDDGVTLSPCVRVSPWRGLVVASAADDAFDLSALNVAATLDVAALAAAPSHVWDVGCGAGLLSLVAARAGARVFASDLDAALVARAQDNAAINGLGLTAATGDSLAAAPSQERFDTIVFNAPLLRAPLAVATGEAPRYSSAVGGEALALAFLDGVGARLQPRGRVLLHAQLTPAVVRALEAWATRAAVTSVVFAHAPDGTPHALTEIALAGAAGMRRVEVPL